MTSYNKQVGGKSSLFFLNISNDGNVFIFKGQQAVQRHLGAYDYLIAPPKKRHNGE